MNDHTPPAIKGSNRIVKRLVAVLRALSSRLPRLAELFERWLCVLDCAGETYEVTGTVPGEGAAAKKIRGRDEYAISTHVFNQGLNPIEFREDGHTILRLDAGENAPWPIRGYGEISAVTVEETETNMGVVDATTTPSDYELTQALDAVFPEPGMVFKILNEEYTVLTAELIGTGPTTRLVHIVTTGPGSALSDEAVIWVVKDTEVKITTVRRCQCDVTAYVDDERPIGGDLI